jgi:integrase
MAAIRTNRHGVICIGFRYRGQRYFLSTGLSDTKQNRINATRKAKAVEYGISINSLDLSRYFPNSALKGIAAISTLSDFFPYYKAEKTIRESSWRSLNWAWDKYIEPHFGSLNLSAIDKHEVMVFRNQLIEKGRAPGTINLIMTHLAGILTRAHEEGKIPTYPMKNMGKLDANSEKIDPFSFDELRHFLDFLDASKPEHYDMVFIWASCGFRMGEILALKWADVDYYNGTVSVNATMLNDGKEGPPKTKNSRRTITMRPTVVESFKRQEKRSRMAGGNVFTNPATGKPYNMPVVFWRRFKNLLTLAGLKDRSPNQLRHTFATLHIGAGENVTWVAQMMGHRNVSTTLERYNKFVPNLTRNDGSAFESALQKSTISGFGLAVDNS